MLATNQSPRRLLKPCAENWAPSQPGELLRMFKPLRVVADIRPNPSVRQRVERWATTTHQLPHLSSVSPHLATIFVIARIGRSVHRSTRCPGAFRVTPLLRLYSVQNKDPLFRSSSGISTNALCFGEWVDPGPYSSHAWLTGRCARGFASPCPGDESTRLCWSCVGRRAIGPPQNS